MNKSRKININHIVSVSQELVVKLADYKPIPMELKELQGVTLKLYIFEKKKYINFSQVIDNDLS